MTNKRPFADVMVSSPSPIMTMFEGFRVELDRHHDRRERVMKASKDITAASKKVARRIGTKLSAPIQSTNTQHLATISTQYASIAPDLQHLNAYRYERQITGGIQEFLEAVSFTHYLTTQKLLTFAEAQQSVSLACQSNDTAPSGAQSPGIVAVSISLTDYLLGIYDMTGELMRIAITIIATTGALPRDASGRTPLDDLRELRGMLEMLDCGRNSPLAREAEKKMDVMRASVEKVERALYGLAVRGAERPKGWMPDVSEGRMEGVEGY